MQRNAAPDLDVAMYDSTQAIRDRWDITRYPARVAAQHKNKVNVTTSSATEPRIKKREN